MNILLAIWGLLSGLLSRFGPWFKQIVKDGETTYDSLETEAQAALQQGSGILAVFNTDLNNSPDVVKALFQKAFPSLSLDVLHGFIDTVQNKIGVIQGEIPVTLDDAIISFQSLLKKYEGDSTFLGRISKLLAGEFAILFSPETPVQKIDDSLEYVYHLIVKPHVAGVIASLPVASAPAVEEHNPAQGSFVAADEVPATPPATEPDETVPPVITIDQDFLDRHPNAVDAGFKIGNNVTIDPDGNITEHVTAAPKETDPDMHIANEAAAGLDANTAPTSEATPEASTNTGDTENVPATPAPDSEQKDLSFDEAIAKDNDAKGLTPPQ